jgi:hypothetical protein
LLSSVWFLCPVVIMNSKFAEVVELADTPS